MTLAASTALSAQPPAEEAAVRPFHFRASAEALSDLVRPVKATKWPDRVRRVAGRAARGDAEARTLLPEISVRELRAALRTVR